MVLMYSVLVCIYTFVVVLYGSTNADEKDCGVWQWIEHASVSMNIIKSGFHREMVTSVQLGPEVPDGLSVLLSLRIPRGVYMDPYQLASLGDDRDSQVLLNSQIDIEAPAHMSEGFTALVYPSLVGGSIKSTIPIHGRYHRPSLTQDNFELVKIDCPRLLLRREACTHVPLLPPHSLVTAPCTASNTSICHWLQIQHVQEKSQASVEVPCGDGTLLEPVCAGTLLITLLCCVALSRSILKHRQEGQC